MSNQHSQQNEPLDDGIFFYFCSRFFCCCLFFQLDYLKHFTFELLHWIYDVILMDDDDDSAAGHFICDDVVHVFHVWNIPYIII